MKEWGITLVFIGLGSFVLPMIGLQFRLLNLFGGSPAAGVLVAAVGGILFAVGFMKERARISPGANREGSGRQSQAPNRAVPEPRNKPITDTGTRCSACSAENAQGDLFCGSCGAALAQIKSQPSPSCVRCGTPLSLDERFCGDCGEPIVASASPSKPQERVPQNSSITSKPRRAAAILGAIIVVVVGALYYTREQPLLQNVQPPPQPAAKPLQQSKEQSGVPSATRIGPYQYGATSNNQKAINSPGSAVTPSEKARSVPAAPRLGPQAYEPQASQENLPTPPTTATPESVPPQQSPPGATNSSKTTERAASAETNLRGIWKGGQYCPYMNTYSTYSANVMEQSQNTFSGTFDFFNTPFRGTIRGDQLTLEYHLGTMSTRWEGRITRVASGLKMGGILIMGDITNLPCTFELYKQ